MKLHDYKYCALTLLAGIFSVLWDANEPRAGAETYAAKVVEAAEQGSPEAQCELGQMHHEGIGASQDDQEAMRWYRKSAAQGNANAQLNLGFMYDQGNGVPQDSKQALFWYGKAAEQGTPEAQFRLGEIFAGGLGVLQNEVVAYAWYSLAATQGADKAIKRRDSLAEQLTPERLSQAKTLAAALQAEIDSKKK